MKVGKTIVDSIKANESDHPEYLSNNNFGSFLYFSPVSAQNITSIIIILENELEISIMLPSAS